MRIAHSRSGFTLVELLVASGVFGAVTVALMTFMSTSTRLIIRNLATNHSHETARLSSQRMLAELHEAASRFQLVNFDGTNYTDKSATTTSDLDAVTGCYLSSRANGVRFHRLVGGPYQFSATAATSDTVLKFDFGPAVNGKLPYVPQVGDRVALPLVNREFKITQIVSTPTPNSPNGKITIDSPNGLGFSIKTGNDSSGNPYTTTGYFYRKSAYTVYNGELRYHDNFEGTSRGNYIVVRQDVTSPNPFALIYSTSTTPASTDALDLRVSLECADLGYSSKNLRNAISTLHTTIPTRTQPPPISNIN